MTPKQRFATRLSLLLILFSGVLLGFALSPQTSQASCSTCNGPFYGVNGTYMSQAIGGTIWPQTTSNACAIADSMGVINYDHVSHDLGLKFPDGGGQTYIENQNQGAGASSWGHATPTNAWGGITNIASDFGNDPRSVAYIVKHYEWSRIYHHDWIYRWQFAHTTEPSFETQAKEATTLLARGVEDWTAPIVTFINGGLHSVLVTGIWSLNDPDANFPADIQGLVYYDSEGNSSIARQEISLSTWISGGYSSPFGVYSLWALYYGDHATRGDMQNSADPDPKVGPYMPTAYGLGLDGRSGPPKPPAKHHWYLGFTWVQRDDKSAVSPDWAFNAYTGQLMNAP